jgi:hypothetical protein
MCQEREEARSHGSFGECSKLKGAPRKSSLSERERLVVGSLPGGNAGTDELRGHATAFSVFDATRIRRNWR